MSKEPTDYFPVSEAWSHQAHVSAESYKALYEKSLREPEQFWAEIATRLTWMKPWARVKNTSFRSPVSIKWFEEAKLNASVNCIDRHLPHRAQQTAIIWESDSSSVESRKISYQELSDEVNRLGNTLRSLGVKKGDRVTIYMPMIPEAAFAMLACARIGAVHSVVFGGFSAESIADRIQDGKSDYVITADEGIRGGKFIDLKKNVDRALEKCKNVKAVVVFKHTGRDVPMQTGQTGSSVQSGQAMQAGRDHWYHEVSQTHSGPCTPEVMDAEDPLFLLYTSGSTNKPKGVLHTTAGYLVYASYTHEVVFDYKDGDIYWCTADVGWVTGHSYIVYGPLANGATTLMFEGVPNYPSHSRFWEVIDKHQVNIFYTSPTAIRSLMREGDGPVKKTNRSSLRLLGSVGEPINPEAWLWFHRVVGEERCPVVDTWWQTETGGIMISPLPGAIGQKPGSATLPFFGVKPILMSETGQELSGSASGNLCIADSWPGQMRTVYSDHARFEQTYFSTYPGYYFTGDGCRRDADGYYWITGRVDDVLNVSGHRLGTAEIESALVAHELVSEAAIVGYPHDLKGQGVYAYVTLVTGAQPSEELRKELIQWVRQQISPIAQPDRLQWAPGLPKTRSGKIMRRILRKIAENQPDQLGDTTTLTDPLVVEELVKNRIIS